MLRGEGNVVAKVGFLAWVRGLLMRCRGSFLHYERPGGYLQCSVKKIVVACGWGGY